MPDAAFIAFTCQRGAEAALKREMQAQLPAARFAFSCPGFLTYKLPTDRTGLDLWNVPLVFARWRGLALESLDDGPLEQRALAAWKLAQRDRLARLHVFAPDTSPVGLHGYAPGPTEAAQAVQAAIAMAAGSTLHLPPSGGGEAALDCVLLPKERWWLGWHPVAGIETSWPGGIPPIALPAHAVSRAWLKLSEALAWSGFSLSPRRRWVEIGCAPGGAAQALLDQGLRVVGIDPAAVDARVLDHPKFTWVQRKAQQVRRRFFRPFTYLVADMNVAPNYTLDCVEAIVTHPEVRMEGLILTLKLIEWKLAEELPQVVERVRGWGYVHIRLRQLAFNRQEVCLVAAR